MDFSPKTSGEAFAIGEVSLESFSTVPCNEGRLDNEQLTELFDNVLANLEFAWPVSHTSSLQDQQHNFTNAGPL